VKEIFVLLMILLAGCSSYHIEDHVYPPDRVYFEKIRQIIENPDDLEKKLEAFDCISDSLEKNVLRDENEIKRIQDFINDVLNNEFNISGYTSYYRDSYLTTDGALVIKGIYDTHAKTPVSKYKQIS
jgi:hypothetical protein